MFPVIWFFGWCIRSRFEQLPSIFNASIAFKLQSITFDMDNCNTEAHNLQIWRVLFLLPIPIPCIACRSTLSISQRVLQRTYSTTSMRYSEESEGMPASNRRPLRTKWLFPSPRLLLLPSWLPRTLKPVSLQLLHLYPPKQFPAQIPPLRPPCPRFFNGIWRLSLPLPWRPQQWSSKRQRLRSLERGKFPTQIPNYQVWGRLTPVKRKMSDGKSYQSKMPIELRCW